MHAHRWRQRQRTENGGDLLLAAPKEKEKWFLFFGFSDDWFFQTSDNGIKFSFASSPFVPCVPETSEILVSREFSRIFFHFHFPFSISSRFNFTFTSQKNWKEYLFTFTQPQTYLHFHSPILPDPTLITLVMVSCLKVVPKLSQKGPKVIWKFP